MSTGTWMRSNLTTQGYCLSDAESRELSTALRFSTGLCLTLVIVALALARQRPASCSGACSLLPAVANLCIPSEMFAWWERRATRKRAAAI